MRSRVRIPENEHAHAIARIRGYDPAARGVVRSSVQEFFLVSGRDGVSMREGPAASRDHVRSMKEAAPEIAIDENRRHRVPEESRSADRVGRTGIPKAGIFSTCSPVIDVKPYVSARYPKGDVRIPAGMDGLMNEVGERQA